MGATDSARLRVLCEYLGGNLSAQRRALRWTQAEFAEHIDCSLRYYQRLERGKVVPSLGLVVELHSMLGVPEFDLFKPIKLERGRPGRPRRNRANNSTGGPNGSGG